ncbi:MAG: hypothetical protein RLZZ518_1224 [Actinomycetota bacterium]
MDLNGNHSESPSDSSSDGFDARRLTMYNTLQKVLGQLVADTLMGHLPPGGWGDVARTTDIDRITLRLDQIDRRLDQIDRHLDQIDQRFEHVDRRLDQIDRRLDLIDQRCEHVDRRLDHLDFNVAGLAAMKRYVIGTGISLAGLICAFGIPVLLYILQR